MDTSSKRVRLAASNSLASVFLSLQMDKKQIESLHDSEIRDSKKKNVNSTAKSGEDEVDGSSPATQKPAVALPFAIDLREILRQLSISYARSSSKYVRSGIILSYAIIFKTLGAPFASANYSTIVQHLLHDIASHPLVGDDKYRTLESRRHIDYLLGHVLRRQMLNEPAMVRSIRVICETIYRKHDGKGNETDPWPIEATVSALTELAGLLQDVGSAIALEQVSSLNIALSQFYRIY